MNTNEPKPITDPDMIPDFIKEQLSKPNAFAELIGDENATVATYFKSESKKEMRRFYLNYPAIDPNGTELRLYVEIEVDEEDPSYLNYWIGCEEHPRKRYIASVQGDLSQDHLLDIVQIKHLNIYLTEL